MACFMRRVNLWTRRRNTVIDTKNRIVQYPNRYRDKISGQVFDFEPYPGTVTEQGTLINKALFGQINNLNNDYACGETAWMNFNDNEEHVLDLAQEDTGGIMTGAFTDCVLTVPHGVAKVVFDICIRIDDAPNKVGSGVCAIVKNGEKVKTFDSHVLTPGTTFFHRTYISVTEGDTLSFVVQKTSTASESGWSIRNGGFISMQAVEFNV